jgi:hypothetical protein
VSPTGRVLGELLDDTRAADGFKAWPAAREARWRKLKDDAAGQRLSRREILEKVNELNAYSGPRPMRVRTARLQEISLVEAVAYVDPEAREIRLPICGLIKRPSDKQTETSEPIDFWHLWAGRAAALFRIAEELREGRKGLEQDWAIVDAGPESAVRLIASQQPVITQRDRSVLSLTVQRHLLALHVNRWLSWGMVDPRVAWEPSSSSSPWSLRFTTSARLFGEIGLQLARAIGRGERLAQCKNCGKDLPAPRNSGRPPRYCDACGTRARWRLAQKDKRARDRLA